MHCKQRLVWSMNMEHFNIELMLSSAEVLQIFPLYTPFLPLFVTYILTHTVCLYCLLVTKQNQQVGGVLTNVSKLSVTSTSSHSHKLDVTNKDNS